MEPSGWANPTDSRKTGGRWDPMGWRGTERSNPVKEKCDACGHDPLLPLSRTMEPQLRDSLRVVAEHIS